MTRYSASRGIMYSAPPTTEGETTEPTAAAAESDEPAAADD
jgi:hypothetical protein